MQLTFGQALEAIKDGRSARRAGWYARGMSLFLCQKETRNDITMREFIAIDTGKGFVIPWTANQLDILAKDWEVIGELR